MLLLRLSVAQIACVFAVFFMWGACATAFNVAFQAELIEHTELDQSAVAMSIFSGLFNLGIGTGTAIGGAVVSGIGIASVGLVGGAIAVVGVVVSILLLFREL